MTEKEKKLVSAVVRFAKREKTPGVWVWVPGAGCFTDGPGYKWTHDNKLVPRYDVAFTSYRVPVYKDHNNGVFTERAPEKIVITYDGEFYRAANYCMGARAGWLKRLWAALEKAGYCVEWAGYDAMFLCEE